MGIAQDDCFVVFVRDDDAAAPPAEAELARCPTYGEARRGAPVVPKIRRPASAVRDSLLGTCPRRRLIDSR